MSKIKIVNPLGTKDEGVLPLGGPGSGNWGHAGRKGQRGGSLGRSTAMSIKTGQRWRERQAMARARAVSFRPGKLSDDPGRRAVEIRALIAPLGGEVARLEAQRDVLNKRWNDTYGEYRVLCKRVKEEGLTEGPIHQQRKDMYGEQRAQWEEFAAASQAHRALKSKVNVMARDVILRATPERESSVPVGYHVISPKSITGRSQVIKNANSAVEFVNGLTRTMSDDVVRNAGLLIRTKSVRENCFGTEIELSRKSTIRTIVHELGHFLENQDITVKYRAIQFLESRTPGNVAQSLRSLTGNRGYRSDEVAKVDKFLSPYMGKIYNSGSTEIISMGLEYLYAEPVRLATQDPGYFDFVLETVWQEY